MAQQAIAQEERPRETDEIAASIRALLEEGQRRLACAVFPCPVDGKPGKYMGDVGSYQIVVPVFVCEDGHRFSVRLDLDNATKLLPDHGGTPNPDK